MEPLIDARHIQKTFGDTPAVRDLSLTVYPGDAYGLVGPDGAGKTTTMRLLAGVMKNEGGPIQVAGYDMGKQPEAARAHLGYLSQRFSLYTDLTVRENLEFFGKMRGMSGRTLTQRASELLGFVGLSSAEGRLAGQLSGGMKQKLGLASALIHRPSILLLDEPTGGVDPLARQDFWQLIIRLLLEGVAVVVTTPYMDEAARCNRLGLMMDGRILQQGSPSELLADFPGEVMELQATPQAKARTIAVQDPDVQDAIPFGDRLHLHVNRGHGVMTRLPERFAANGITITSLRPVAPTLEDLFVALWQPQEKAEHRN